MVQNKPRNKLTRWQVAGFAFEMGYIIALPILIFGLLGKRLDVHFDTDPYIALGGIILAIVTTTLWLKRRLSKIFNSFRNK